MLLPKRVTTLLVDKAPPIMSMVRKLVPNNLERQLVLYLINHLSKEFMQSGELDFMQGKIAKISIPDINVNWFFTQESSAGNSNTSAPLKMLKQNNEQPITAHVTFTGNFNAMILMASQKVDPDTLFFNRDLAISGDTELGLEIKNLIDQFDLNVLQSPIKKLLKTWSEHLLEAQHG